MAARTAEQIRRDIAAERGLLVDAVGSLREELDLGKALQGKLPMLVAGAAGAGFFLGGGIGATMRLLARRSREGKMLGHVGGIKILED